MTPTPDRPTTAELIARFDGMAVSEAIYGGRAEDWVLAVEEDLRELVALREAVAKLDAVIVNGGEIVADFDEGSSAVDDNGVTIVAVTARGLLALAAALPAPKEASNA
jgi:hypothetical protein